jgi:hypothetical protein
MNTVEGKLPWTMMVIMLTHLSCSSGHEKLAVLLIVFSRILLQLPNLAGVHDIVISPL